MEKKIENKTSISKNKYLIPTVLMIIYIFIAMIIVVVVKFSMATEGTAVSITANSGEEAFFNGKYDVAVSEYSTYQQKEEWPVWNLKISEIYSIQGDYKKSNEYIQKVYDARNKIIDTENVKYEEFESKDRELVNGIVFNSFVNGEYKKALEYGEFFLQSYPNDVNLLKTMFFVYIANDDKKSAENIINYFNDGEDSDELVTAAKMSILLGKYEDGIKMLEESFELDENNINIFDALEDAARYNKSSIVDSINKLSSKDKNNKTYKLFLAKVYSIDYADIEKAEKIIDELADDFEENTSYLFIKMRVYVEKNEDKKAEKILDDISELNKDTYISEYADSLRFYYEGKYDEALKSAKKCISLNNEYTNTYSSLIPSILLGQKKVELEESYLRTALYKEPFNFADIITTAEYYMDVRQDSSKGLYYYNLASKVNPDNSEVYYKMALIQYNNQRIDEAAALLKKSISLNKTCAKYYRALGNMYLEKNKYEEGMTQIRKAYDIDKEDIATLNSAAYYYIYADHNINRAMTNIKAAYEGINDTTSTSVRDIITDNYNRIKVLYDSSKDSALSNKNGVVSEVKLIY